MASYEKTAKRILKMVEAEKLALTIAKDTELFIDLDDVGPMTERKLKAKLDLIDKTFCKIVSVHRRISKSENGWHIRVVLDRKIKPMERVALHILAGSDPLRELLRMRAIRGRTDDQQSIFLDKPKHPETVLWTAEEFRKAA